MCCTSPQATRTPQKHPAAGIRSPRASWPWPSSRPRGPLPESCTSPSGSSAAPGSPPACRRRWRSPPAHVRSTRRSRPVTARPRELTRGMCCPLSCAPGPLAGIRRGCAGPGAAQPCTRTCAPTALKPCPFPPPPPGQRFRVWSTM